MNELVPQQPQPLTVNQQEIQNESMELSLHSELQCLRWMLSHEIETNGQESRRAVNLVAQITKTSESQARLGLLGGHVLLRSMLERDLQDARDILGAKLREAYRDVIATIEKAHGIEISDEEIEAHMQMMYKSMIAMDVVVSADHIAALNREGGAR